jgi:hypothetical protein
MSSGHDAVATAIIQGQMRMIGDVALNLANKVPSLTVQPDGTASIGGDAVGAIEALVREYSSLTGQLGVRMCYTSAKPALDANPSVSIPSFAAFAA